MIGNHRTENVGRTRVARWLVGLIGAAAMLGLTGRLRAAPPTAPETIDRALARQAPAILNDLRQHGYKNVGVLKFRVKKGDGRVSDRVGLINQSLADRLEIALILANDWRHPLGIIHDAGRTAATLPGADHLKAEGRRILLKGKYPLAWGRTQVSPDAILTGVVLVSSDLRTMTVSVQAFDATENVLRPVTQFHASTDPPALIEIGESLLVRGGFDNDEFKQQPGRAFQPQAKNSLESPAAPVTLEAWYDGARIPLEFAGNQGNCPSPRRVRRSSSC